jgi:hypothetical protein
MECPGFEPASGSGLTPGAIIDLVLNVNGARQNLTIKVYGVSKCVVFLMISYF